MVPRLEKETAGVTSYQWVSVDIRTDADLFSVLISILVGHFFNQVRR